MFETTLLSPDVLDDRAVWVHLLLPSVGLLKDDADGTDPFGVLLRCLNVREEQVSSLYERLEGPLDAYEDVWDEDLPFYSALDVPLPGGTVWRVGFWGGDDPGVYHEVRDASGQPLPLDEDHGGTVGWVDIHWQLPVLRWAEVQPLARVAGQGAPGLRPEHAFLLFASTAFLTAQDDAGEARAAWQAALEGIGTPPEGARELAERLTFPGWGFNVADLADDSRETCRDAPLTWWNPEGQGWRCNARRGFRREGSRWQARGSLRVFDELLARAGVVTP